MTDTLNRRTFMTLLGAGTASVGLSAITPSTLAQNDDSSTDDTGGFQVNRLNGEESAYQVDPQRLKAMTQLNTVFSRNGWDPARQERPELNEDLSRDRPFIPALRATRTEAVAVAVHAATGERWSGRGLCLERSFVADPG